MEDTALNWEIPNQNEVASDPFWILYETSQCFKLVCKQPYGGTKNSEASRAGTGNKILVIQKVNYKLEERGRPKDGGAVFGKPIHALEPFTEFQLFPACTPEDERSAKLTRIAGLLGIININGFNFILAIMKNNFVGKFEQANIYEITEVELFPFGVCIFQEALLMSWRTILPCTQQYDQSCKNYIDGIKTLLKMGFYFSYNADITSNRQRTARVKSQYRMSASIFETCDTRYFWNYNICQDFVYQQIDSKWVVPIMQGFVEYQPLNFDGKELELLMISRRRHLMAGTRYNSRGLDDHGNVANYVESESIICYRNQILSFVQVRGSVPLFWQQKGIAAHTSVKRTPEITSKIFDIHVNEMVSDYKLVLFINLLQRNRSWEDMLTKSLENQFQLCKPKCAKYTYYDFHSETKGENFHRLNDLMMKIEEMINRFSYFIEERGTGKVIQEQKGIFRSNCLDCLDRTNHTQQKIAMRILEQQLDKLKKLYQNSPSKQHQDMVSYVDNDDSIFEVYKNMWAENGDLLSKQYAGTASTITTVTRTGKQGLIGKLTQGMTSVQRFIQNNLEDDFKHECIRLLLNQHPKQQTYGIKASLEKQLQKYAKHYLSTENLTCCVFTWNLAGNLPTPSFDISNLVLQDDKSFSPDIYVVGLQEMVKLNAKSVIQGKDKQRVLLWEQIMTRSLSKKARYVCVAKKAMVGCFIMLFAQDRHKFRITNLRTTKVKTGFGGQSGNKGSVNIRFDFDDTPFLFINCHLSSGQGQNQDRLEDVREIYRRCFDTSIKYQDYCIEDHHYKFLFGDMNFRISLPDDVVRESIRRQNLSSLWSKDQLIMNKHGNSNLSKYKEGELNFNPTYKYDDRSDSYDSSQKKRIPAWCDRILYESSGPCTGNIIQHFYGRRESYFSDHRPVFGVFELQVCQINKQKKKDIESKLLGTIKEKPKNSSPGIADQMLTDIVSQENAGKNLDFDQANFQLQYLNIDDGYCDRKGSDADNMVSAGRDEFLEKQQAMYLQFEADKTNVQQEQNLISLFPSQNDNQAPQMALRQNPHRNTQPNPPKNNGGGDLIDLDSTNLLQLHPNQLLLMQPPSMPQIQNRAQSSNLMQSYFKVNEPIIPPQGAGLPFQPQINQPQNQMMFQQPNFGYQRPQFYQGSQPQNPQNTNVQYNQNRFMSNQGTQINNLQQQPQQRNPSFQPNQNSQMNAQQTSQRPPSQGRMPSQQQQMLVNRPVLTQNANNPLAAQPATQQNNELMSFFNI